MSFNENGCWDVAKYVKEIIQSWLVSVMARVGALLSAVFCVRVHAVVQTFYSIETNAYTLVTLAYL